MDFHSFYLFYSLISILFSHRSRFSSVMQISLYVSIPCCFQVCTRCYLVFLNFISDSTVSLLVPPFFFFFLKFVVHLMQSGKSGVGAIYLLSALLTRCSPVLFQYLPQRVTRSVNLAMSTLTRWELMLLLLYHMRQCT